MENKDMVSLDEISPLSEIDIKKAVEDAQVVSKLFQEMGIKEATLVNGNYYHHNQDTDTKKVVSKGCIIEENQNTVIVTLQKTSASSLDAVEELSDKTQKVLAAFAGKSQPWIPNNKREK
jgi:hypothetical protein